MARVSGSFWAAAHRTRLFAFWRLLAVMMLALAALLAAPALSQDDDQGLLARTLQNLLSDAGREVRIVGFQGALSSRATIDELSIADDDGVWIVLRGVVLDWNRAALLDRRVSVNELSADVIEVLRLPGITDDPQLPSPTARAPFELPELPVSVTVGELSATRVLLDAAVLGQAAEATLAGSANLANGQGTTQFVAERTDGSEGLFRLSGDFDNATRTLSIDLTLTEGPNGIAAALLGIPDRPALGLTVRGVGPVATFAAEIALATDGVERVEGRFALTDDSPDSGVLRGGGFELALEGDLRPLLSAELHPFFGAASRLRAVGSRDEDGAIDLPQLRIDTVAMQLSGRAALNANGFPNLVELRAAINRDGAEPVVLPGTGGDARLGRARLEIRHDASVSRDWRIEAQLQELSLPRIVVGSVVLDARGRLNAQASTDEQTPAFEGVFDVVAQDLSSEDPALQQALGRTLFGFASLAWRGGGAPVEVTGLALEGDTVSLTSSGALDGLTYDGFIEFDAPDLSVFSGLAGRALGGRALTTLDGQMNPATGALDVEAELITSDLTVDIDEVDALLAGESRISLSLSRTVEGTDLRRFDVSAGTLDLAVSGAILPNLADLRAQVEASDLTLLGPGYGGRIALDLLFEMRDDRRHMRFDGAAVDLLLGDLPGAGALDGLLQGANRMRGDLVQQGGRTEVAQFTLDGPFLDFEATGHWSRTDPDLTLSLARLDLMGLGPEAGGTMFGAVRITGSETGLIRTAATLNSQGSLRTGNRAFDGLLSGALRLDAQVLSAPDGTLVVESADLRTEALTVTAQGARDDDGAARMRVEAELDSLARLIRGIRGAARLSADLTHAPGQPGYGLSAVLRGPSEFQLRADGRIGGAIPVDLRLDGQMQAELFNPLIEPTNVQGRIAMSGALSGRAGIESLRLNATATGGRLSMPGPGVAFRDIAASARINGQLAEVELSGVSLSGGRGNLSGTITLDRRRDADLTLRVDSLAITQPRLFQARVTGSASLTGALSQGPLLRGDVAVEQAEILIPNSPLARSGFHLTGLRHVGVTAAARATQSHAGIASGTRHGGRPVPLNLDLALRAPGRVFVRGRGLDAELGGTLRLGGTTGDVVPSGSFGLIRGRLDLLGNRFTLTEGSASMIGSFVPFVRLTATTDSDGVQTSVTISGQADSPEITFNSVPELPQDEVLARLIFRQSLASLSPFQAAQLALSVATLTGTADSSVLDRTRRAIGLDDLDFTVDDEGNAAISLGRYLSDDVYTDLSVDSTGQGEVTINLDLSPTITLRGRANSDGGSGVGIFFERDY